MPGVRPRHAQPPDDVEDVREGHEEERERHDRAERPVGSGVARLQLGPEVVDQEDGREQEDVDRGEDHGVDERREETRERARGVARPFVERSLAAVLQALGAFGERGAHGLLPVRLVQPDRKIGELARRHGGSRLGRGASGRVGGAIVETSSGAPPAGGEDVHDERRVFRGAAVHVAEQVRGGERVRSELARAARGRPGS